MLTLSMFSCQLFLLGIIFYSLQGADAFGPSSRPFARHATLLSFSNNIDNEDRAAELGRVLRSFGEITNKDTTDLAVGSTVVAQNDIPSLGIWQFQSYELFSVYDQGVSTEDGRIEKLQRQSLSEPIETGYTRYVELYSGRYHEEPVKLTPQEVGLVSMREEVVDSLLMALPVFGFWTFVAISFANNYNLKYGGDFLNALFRT